MTRNTTCLIVAMLATLLATVGISAQTSVSPYRPGVTTEGVTYFLPRTALRIVVTAEKSEFTPGELGKYAERYLRQNARSEASTLWTMQSVAVNAYGVPDTSRVYTVALRQKTVAPLVSLTADGILMGIRTECAEPAMPLLPARTAAPESVDPRRFFTQEMLAAGSKAKLAELVAQEIFDIREAYKALTRGEADNTPKDGRQLELMLTSLQQQEDALTTLFLGTTRTSTEVYTLNIVPDGECSRQMIARFSRHLGLVDSDNLAGAPIYMDIRALETLPDPADDPKAMKARAKLLPTAVRYNVPARAEVKLYDATRTLLTMEQPFAQLGHEEILSATLFDKGVTTRATFSPVTGGLLKLSEE